MWDLLRVAVRNVGRNRRRSLITIFTIFMGVLVVTGTRGLLNGLQDEIKSTLARKMHGDLQLHLTGYRESIESSPFKVMFSFDPELEQKIRATKMIEEISPRLRIVAMLNHQRTQSTLPVLVQAFDSRKELKVCPRIATSITKGKMLDSALERQAQQIQDDDLGEASFLDADTNPDNPSTNNNSTNRSGYHQVLLSPSLFDGLGAKMGDEIVLLLQDKNNMQQALIANITGVLDYALPTAQAKIMWMDYHTLASSLSLSNEVSELALASKVGLDKQVAKNTLQQAIGDGQVVETYLELSGFFSDAMEIQNTVFNVVIMIVFAIVISAIINTSLMTVMERVREIGTLMALGYRRRHILFLFLCESAVIGVVGALCAQILVGILMLYLNSHGIVLTLPGQVTSTILYPRITVEFLVFVMLLAIFCAILAAFVPAYRASRMKPVDALNQS